MVFGYTDPRVLGHHMVNGPSNVLVRHIGDNKGIHL